MTSMCVCVILKWFRWLWIGVSVGGSKSWWVLCRTHWGLGETFQTSTDEKGVAAGWRALKMRVFICSWMKPKYPWQELCCCYYCLISLSLGGISGSLPESGWNQPSLSYEFTGLSGSSRLCTLSLQPNGQLNNIAWKQRRKHGSSIFPFERRPDWVIPLCLAHSAASHGGEMMRQLICPCGQGKSLKQSSGVSCPSGSFICHLPSVATAATSA